MWFSTIRCRLTWPCNRHPGMGGAPTFFWRSLPRGAGGPADSGPVDYAPDILRLMAAAGGSFQDWTHAPLPDLRAAIASLPTVEYTRAAHYEDLLMARPGIPRRATNSHHRRLQRKARAVDRQEAVRPRHHGQVCGQRASATPEASRLMAIPGQCATQARRRPQGP